jgi:hypothetical protein
VTNSQKFNPPATQSILSRLASAFGVEPSPEERAARLAADFISAEIRRRQSESLDDPQGYYVNFTVPVSPEVIRRTANRIRRRWQVETDSGELRVVLRHSGAFCPYKVIDV